MLQKPDKGRHARARAHHDKRLAAVARRGKALRRAPQQRHRRVRVGQRRPHQLHALRHGRRRLALRVCGARLLQRQRAERSSQALPLLWARAALAVKPVPLSGLERLDTLCLEQCAAALVQKRGAQARGAGEGRKNK